MEIKKTPSLDYSNFPIDSKVFSQKNRLEPSDMTIEELLRLRAEKEYNRTKSTMLSAHSMEEDLYSSVSGSFGISIFSEKMHVLNPVTENIINARLTNTSLTDCQFINNFVTKESFYKDQIEKNYSGDELQAKLKEFEAISDKVINDISDKYANSIEDFFNGKLDSLGYTSAPINADAAKNSEEPQEFNVEDFKSHILDIVNENGKILENIKMDSSK